jgi:hypothetical protein
MISNQRSARALKSYGQKMNAAHREIYSLRIFIQETTNDNG